MAYRPLAAIVLAAGDGTRMLSATPKVLHPVCGRPLLAHVLGSLSALPLERIVVVVGRGADEVTKTMHDVGPADVPIEFVEQRRRLGTGDATSVGLTVFTDELDVDDDVLVLCGDTPLLRPETLASLATEHRVTGAAATLLTAVLDDPQGYGRVLRDSRGGVARVVEERDASDDERLLDEVNTSIYCFRRSLLAPALRRINPENAQGEYYLTDVVEVLCQAGHPVGSLPAEDASEALGVNDRVQLARAEAVLRERINAAWMRAGVSMTDPDRTYIDIGVALAPEVQLRPGTILEGRTVVGARSVIGPDAHLVDTVVGEDSIVERSVAREADIGDGVTVGPFAHLRPGTRLGARSRVGNFVETKNAELGVGAKANHLSYLGDADVGDGANVGAGTITANYDGHTKHHTRIGARARIGSNTVLVAPVEIGDGAVTGAGAVVTRSVPPGALAKGVPAEVDPGWVARRESGDATGETGDRTAGATSRDEAPTAE